MIDKIVKASPIFGEFSPDEQNRFFDFSKEKVSAHVDSEYFTCSVLNDSNECSVEMQNLLRVLSDLRQKKLANKALPVEFFVLSLEPTRFVHYEYCLRLDENFDIFISSFLPNDNTPRIVVQLRTRILVQLGVCQAICKSFRYIEDILGAFGLEVDEVRENRIDYAFHTNLIQNPYKYFSDSTLLRKLKTKLRTYHKVGDIGKKIDIDYISFGHRNSNDIFVRIYNKSREVIEKNYKSFFIDKWLQDKLISNYDYYVYSKAYEAKSYVTGMLVGRIDWYLEFGHCQEIKDQLIKVKKSCYVNSDNTDQLRKIVDSYLPPVTLILNVEFQTKRKFYHSYDQCIQMYQKSYLNNGQLHWFENGALPLFRLFTIYDIRSQFLNYLTGTSLSFVEKKGTEDEHMSYWWQRIHQCYIQEYDRRIIELWREYERHTDIEKTKRRVCGTVASMSILQNNGYVQKPFLEDVSDMLCVLNDNDFYGFAQNPETGDIPICEPDIYSVVKKRKFRQLKPILSKQIKDIEKIKKECEDQK